MATDFAVQLFELPVLVGIIALLCIAFLGRKRPPTFLGLNRGRVALGYLGALSALLIYSVFDAFLLARNKVSFGMTISEAYQRIPGWTLYLFILAAPFVVFFLTILGFPALAALRRVRLGSVGGVLIASQLVAALPSVVLAIFPDNLWCESHRLECVGATYAATAIFCATVAFGFGLGANLPWLRNA